MGTFGGAISFDHRYSLDPVGGGPNYFDGAVLEISCPTINSGAFTDVADPLVGGNFIGATYNGTISTAFSNPIGGRMAWSQNSGGYRSTFVILGFRVRGQTVRFRFRMCSDSAGMGEGWRVDNVRVTMGCESTPPPAPTRTPGVPEPVPPGNCYSVLTQSTSQVIAPDNVASCNFGSPNFFHSDNSYWRAFNMGGFTDGSAYLVNSVSFGIESATANPAIRKCFIFMAFPRL